MRPDGTGRAGHALRAAGDGAATGPPLEMVPVEWAAPPSVGAQMSTRRGGVSRPPFDSLNLRPAALGGAPGEVDDPASVAENQRRFAQAARAVPVYLEQVHGAQVVRLRAADACPGAPLHRADAAVTTEAGIACTVLVADCLPVLLATRDGAAVGAAHAGWRGLAGGVLDAAVAALCHAAGVGPADCVAWLGPCIGPDRFEVGADVLAAFGTGPASGPHPAFKPAPRADGSPRWLADLPALARARLGALGVQDVAGGAWCTVSDASRFFSYRRDVRTGRLAAAVWRRT